MQRGARPALRCCARPRAAEAEIVKVADGATDKETERCTKLLPAGAVLLKWEADPDYEEEVRTALPAASALCAHRRLYAVCASRHIWMCPLSRHAHALYRRASDGRSCCLQSGTRTASTPGGWPRASCASNGGGSASERMWSRVDRLPAKGRSRAELMVMAWSRRQLSRAECF